ncbi:hypothetical protein PaeCFBP13512_19720 [Paenibacillus sp. CFBP13512]|nr:hypothetical protein PaeCFBP13512_19720 [Paenibacillus sp. CFBP13512]
MLSEKASYNESTIRTHIGSRCCVNANANHAVTYNDYERIRHGTYQLYEPTLIETKNIHYNQWSNGMSKIFAGIIRIFQLFVQKFL